MEIDGIQTKFPKYQSGDFILRRDITQIHIYYADGTTFWGYVAWGNNDYINTCQKNSIDRGFLIIDIQKRDFAYYLEIIGDTLKYKVARSVGNFFKQFKPKRRISLTEKILNFFE